jgi:hypothetical protein
MRRIVVQLGIVGSIARGALFALVGALIAEAKPAGAPRKQTVSHASV